MSAVLQFNQKLQTETCFRCGIVFAVPDYFREMRLQDKQSFYCPNGHSQAYIGSEVDRLKKQLEQEKRNAEWWKNLAASKDSQIKGASIQLGKVKAKLHRTERRVANGICPCCHRTFINMQRHMKSKHPDYVEEAVNETRTQIRHRCHQRPRTPAAAPNPATGSWASSWVPARECD